MIASQLDDDLSSIDGRCPEAANVSLHFVGEQGLLLDPGRRKLYALNTCATLIWCLLKEGKSLAEAGRLLVEQFAVPVDIAQSYLADVLAQYDALSTASETLVETHTPLRPGVAYRGNARRDAGVAATYSLLDRVFHVHYDSMRLFEAVHPLLRHRTPTNGMSHGNVGDIAVVTVDDGVIVVAGDQAIGSARMPEEAAAAVRACLTQLAVSSSGGLCAIHAGALCRDGRALLLPGEAGSGKSTLSAGLAARGFDMLSDDTVVLSGDPPLARSMPMGLCLKQGACAVLEADYPQLPSLPQWRRPDGKLVRYLMPNDDLSWAAPDTALAVRWLVFPRYHPDSNTALLPLPRHEALARLLRGVHFLSGPLDAANLDRLIAWMERIDCFELPLSSLDEAGALIEGLCR
jgi:hypothetical protein